MKLIIKIIFWLSIIPILLVNAAISKMILDDIGLSKPYGWLMVFASLSAIILAIIEYRK